MDIKKTLTASCLSLVVSNHVFSLFIDNFEGPTSLTTKPLSNNTGTTLNTICSTVSPMIARDSNAGSNTAFQIENTKLLYEGNTAASLSYSSINNTFDFTNNPQFVLNFDSSSSDPITKGLFDVSISLQDNNGLQIGIQNTINSMRQIFDFTSGFNTTPSFNKNSISTITFTFNPNNAADGTNDLNFYVDSIEAVPEPFSLITLATGTAAFIRKRKKGS